MSTVTQSTRPLAIGTALGSDELLLIGVEGHEELSRLFTYKFDVLSHDDDVDVSAIIGESATIRVENEESGTRYINGVVSEFVQIGRGEEFSRYQGVLVPEIWLLGETRDCRIFQKKNTKKIVSEIFDEFDILDVEWKLTDKYPKRVHCVQYCESYLDFVSRLLEEEGIFYYFRHENGKHTLVLADDKSAYYEVPDSNASYPDHNQQFDRENRVVAWRQTSRIQPGAFDHCSYNFETPSKDLKKKKKGRSKFRNAKKLEIFENEGRHDTPERAAQLAEKRIEELEANIQVGIGSSTCSSFAPGCILTFSDHQITSEIGRSYALTGVETKAFIQNYDVSGEGFEFSNTFRAVPADVTFRPERLTPRPIIDGSQTALVVGPQGEEIYTDKYGRVKLHFHWDRRSKRDENSSRWVRVSQVHAGNGFGQISIPRIGDEVLVSFLEGDPDQPIVKGRTYNAETTSPFGLPGEMTRSGMKSNTHKGSGYNEMTLDDTAGQEQIRVHAQHNMDTTIGNDVTESIGNDRMVSIGVDDSLTIGVDASADVGNDQNTIVEKNTTYEVANDIVIDVGTSITLSCGKSKIHMNQAGVISIQCEDFNSLAMVNNNLVSLVTEIAGNDNLDMYGLLCLDLAAFKQFNGEEETKINGTGSVTLDGSDVVVKGSPIELDILAPPAPKVPPGQDDGCFGGGPASPDGPQGTGSGSGGESGGGEGGDGTQAEVGETPVDDATAGTEGDETNNENDESPDSDDGADHQPNEHVSDAEDETTTATDEETSPSSSVDGQPSDSDDATGPVRGMPDGNDARDNPEGESSQEGGIADDVTSGTSDGIKAGADEIAAKQKADANAVKEKATADANSLDEKAQAARANAEKAEELRKAAERNVAANADTKEGMRGATELDQANQKSVQAGARADRATSAADQARDIAKNLPTGEEASSAAKGLSKGAEVLGKVGGVVGDGITAYQGGQKAYEQIQQGDGRGASETIGSTVGDIAGGAYGAAKGAVGGAALGMVVCGPPCAIVGGVVGAVGGGYIGGEIGGAVGGAVGGSAHDVGQAAHDIVVGGNNPPSSAPRIPTESASGVSYSLPDDQRHRCFAGDVQVATPDGLRRIDELRVGDVVYCFDSDLTLATSSIARISEARVRSTIAIQFPEESVVTTEAHRWFISGRGWCAAKEIGKGDICITSENLQLAIDRSLDQRDSMLVFNLQLDEHHNFFVGRNRILVHNGIKN